jgi:sporulation protein YlmC with PRC-barrel domain
MSKHPDPLRVDFHLLDRQIVDRDGNLVAKVDDVELATDDQGRLRVVALLAGQHVLGDRIGGWIGRFIAGVARRQHPDRPEAMRIPIEDVERVEAEVLLRVSTRDLPDRPLEAWLAAKVIGRIPGAGDAS